MVLKSQPTDENNFTPKKTEGNVSLREDLEKINNMLLLDKLNNVSLSKGFTALNPKELDLIFSGIDDISVKSEESSKFTTEKEFISFFAKVDDEFLNYDFIEKKLGFLKDYCNQKGIEEHFLDELKDNLHEKDSYLQSSVQTALTQLFDKNDKVMYRGKKFRTEDAMFQYIKNSFSPPKKTAGGPMMMRAPVAATMIEAKQSFTLREDMAKLYATFTGSGIGNIIKTTRENSLGATPIFNDAPSNYATSSTETPAAFGIVLKMDASKRKASPVCYDGDRGMAAQEAEMVSTHFFAQDIIEVTVLEKGEVVAKLTSLEDFEKYQVSKQVAG